MRIVSETLPEWDKKNPLVGDVLILERELSCQFFLIICRLWERVPDKADGHIGNRIGEDLLRCWERLLFTRDFHIKYYMLRSRDNFPELFASCWNDNNGPSKVIERYLKDGFRPDVTKDLQLLVREYLNGNRVRILTDAFNWWKAKMTYAIYKYEISNDAKIRDVMKGTISVEHILPQERQREWIDGRNGALSDEEFRRETEKINGYINGVGNLLLITSGENTSASNNHPADKKYCRYHGGSYKEHDQNPELWRSSANWPKLINERGEKIFDFMLKELVAAPASAQDSSPPVT